MRNAVPPSSDLLTPRFNNTWWTHALVAIACAIAGRVGLSFAIDNPGASAVWPASGVALAALLLLGRPACFAIGLGAFAAHVTSLQSVPWSIVASAGSTLAAWCGATMVTRRAGSRSLFSTTQSVFRFVLLGCVASALAASTLGMTSLYLFGVASGARFGHVWLTWWLGHATGAMLVAPVILLWAANPRLGWSRAQAVEFIAVSATLGGAGWLALLGTGYPMGYVCLGLCVWAALRFGQREGATVACAFSVIVAWATIHGRGVFSQYPLDDALWLGQLFVATFAVTGVAVGAAVAERTLAEQRLRELNGALGDRVRERTRELHAALERATISESRLAEAQQLAHVGSWEWVLTDPAPTWSAELYRICGLEPHSVPAKAELLSKFVHADDRDRVRQIVQDGLRNQQPYECEYRIVRPNHDVRTVHLRGRAVLDDTGKAVRMVGTVQDVTDRNRLEQQLRQSHKLEALGQLAAGIAHDFNNLLTPIIGFTELVLADSAQHPEIAHDVQEIRKAAGSAAALTRQLLMFSRKERPQIVAVDLNAVVSTIEPILERTIGKHIRLMARKADQLRTVQGDPTQLQQVILNLAVNARDAMPGGGVLTIETANIDVDTDYVAGEHLIPSGPFVRVSVSDTGQGMDVDTQRRLFEPFFTTKPDGRGTGLGLATVAGIVEPLGGRIWVYSRVGHGTVFKVYLPAPDPSGQVHLPQPLAPAGPCGGENILVVEDDNTMRGGVATVLRKHGYRVSEASSHVEALDLMQRQGTSIDLVLMDVIVGKSMSEPVPLIPARTRVLYMSGYSAHAMGRTDVEHAVRTLEKPVASRELLEQVRQALDRAPEFDDLARVNRRP